MSFVEIDVNKCKGCQLCISACPKDALSLTEESNPSGYYPAGMVEGVECVGCGFCYQICPDAAITVYKDQQSGGMR